MPNNFVFCLNKIDQLSGFRVQNGFASRSRDSMGPEPEAAAELRDDYAVPVQRTLSLAIRRRFT